MKKKYTLYLDESETHKYNKVTGRDEKYHFCMAGVIVAEDDIPKLENDIKELKKNIWDKYSDPESIILHQMRIMEAEKGRLDAHKYPEYAKFSKKAERNKFYDELKKIGQSRPNIFGTLKHHLYDGLQGKPDRYGIKYMP